MTSPSQTNRVGALGARSASWPDLRRFSASLIEHGHLPQHGEDRDIFERLYAVRLDRLRALEECRSFLKPLDRQEPLAGAVAVPVENMDSMDEDELLAELGVEGGASDITELRHVRTSAERRTAEQ